MEKVPIYTDRVFRPGPIGGKAYISHAIRWGDLVFVSAKYGVDPSGRLADGVEKQTIQTLENIGLILDAAGTSLEGVLKATIFVKEIKNFSIIDSVYSKYFKVAPARSFIEVSNLLVPGVHVQIEVVAGMMTKTNEQVADNSR